MIYTFTLTSEKRKKKKAKTQKRGKCKLIFVEIKTSLDNWKDTEVQCKVIPLSILKFLP